MSKRLEGGFLTARPTWSTAATPGVWAAEQHFARVYANGWPSASALFDPYFESVSLLLHMDGSNASTTFVDSSLNNLTVTANGNAQISTAQSKFGGSSAVFDGTGDYLATSTTSAYNFGNGAFTVEGWVYISANSSANSGGIRAATIASCVTITGSYAGWALSISGNSTTTGTGLTFEHRVNSTTNYGYSAALSISQSAWHHVAVCRSDSTLYFFVNGVLIGTSTLTSQDISTANSLWIGRQDAAGYTNDLNGYIDDLRITRGVARYTANFTVPGVAGYDEGAALYDPYFDYVSLLLRCNGANNSTTFTDSSNNALTVTANGNAQISATRSRFGGASAYFDGAGDWLSCPNTNAQFSFGTGDFTYEFWFNSTDTKAYSAFLTRPYSSPGGILISLNGSTGDGAPEIYWNEYFNGLFFKSSVTGLNNGRWHHFAFVRTGTTCYMFINGTQVASKSSVSTSVGSTTVYIGTDSVYAGRDYVGYIDDLRITKGVCRYATAFRPVGPYGTSGKLVDPYLASTSLLLPMTGDNGTTSFFDRSNNLLRATEYGNAKVSTTQSKFGGTSAYFDGTGDYLSYPASTSWQLFGGDFTVEFWCYPQNTSSNQAAIEFYVDINNRWNISFVNNIDWYTAVGGVGAQAIAATAPAINTWHHIALVKSGTTFTLYVNGSSVGTSTTTSYTTGVPSLYVGSGATGSNFQGYIDDLRITKGTARYTSAFIPPARAFNDELLDDPYFNNVSLLLHMDGANNSTTFTDSSVNALTVTANGNAQISTAQSKFGGTSAAFDGAGDYLTVSSSLTRLSSGDHTVEFWFYVSTLPTSGNEYFLWAQYYASGAPSGRCFTKVNSTGTVTAQLGSSSVTSTATVATGTWNHIAYTRSGTANYLFLNGTMEGSFSSSQLILDTEVSLGALNANTGTSPSYNQAFFNGYIDDLRITKGVARYTSNFVPPTVAFYNPTAPTSDPSFSSVSLLLPMNGSNGSTTFTDSSSNALTVTANGNAQISTAQRKFGGASAAFDGTGDYLTCPSSTTFDFGAGDFTIELWVYGTMLSGADRGIISKGWTSGTTGGWLIYYNNAANKFSFFASSNGTVWDIAADVVVLSAPQTATWHHLAVTRSGNTFRTFANGTLASTFTSSASILVNSSHSVSIGAGTNGSGPFNGYIDDLRITKGVARYTANFTPPIAALPTA